MKISNKIIIITQNSNLSNAVTDFCFKNHFDIETAAELHSLDFIINEMEKTKSTAFLRAALHAFIRKESIPFFIVTDYPVVATSQHDVNVQKIFKTMLISFMIIAQGSGLTNIKGNFFINVTGGDIKALKDTIIHPEKLIALIKVSDQKVNAIMHHYADQKAFHSLFYIKPVVYKTNEEILHELSTYVEAIHKRHTLIEKLIEKQAQVQSKNKDAAKVLVKISKDKIALDREVVITRDKTYQKYEENHIYVIGDWSNFNSRKVAGKVITAIKDGFADWKPGIGDQVCLHLEEAVVDHTTAATLAQIIFNDLKAYSNIKIYCHEPNYKILESADGFSMIRKLVFIQKA